MSCFKKLPGVRLPERKQGLIRFLCLNIEEQPMWMRQKFERLCIACGGVHHCALREVMTTEKSVESIAYRYHVDERTLRKLRKAFYESW